MQGTGKIIVCLVAWLLTGCAGTVSVDFDKEISFGAWQTYALAGKSDKSTEDVRLNSSLIDRRITAALHKNLQAAGFRAEPHNPDFYVSYRLNLRHEIAGRSSGLGVGVGTGVGRAGFGLGYRVPLAEVTASEKCVLSVDIISAGTDELAWRGVGMSAFEQVDSPAELDRLFTEIVRRILCRFPPAPPK